MKEIAHRVLKEWDKDGDKDRGSKGGDAGRDLTRGVDGVQKLLRKVLQFFCKVS